MVAGMVIATLFSRYKKVLNRRFPVSALRSDAAIAIASRSRRFRGMILRDQ